MAAGRGLSATEGHAKLVLNVVLPLGARLDGWALLNVALPALTAALSVGGAGILAWRFAKRRTMYHLVWALGLAWYALSAGTEAIGGTAGWTPNLYRAWYLT